MKYFGTQTNYLLDKSKPYQRPELRHAGPTSVNREAELERPSRVACSDLLGVMSLSHCKISDDQPQHNSDTQTDHQVSDKCGCADDARKWSGANIRRLPTVMPRPALAVVVP